MAISGIGSSYNQIGAVANYVQEKTNARDAGRKMAEQPVSLFISDAGKEQYRNSVQQGGQESYDAILQWREQLKNEKISLVDYAYEISKRAGTREGVSSTAGRADGYVKAYAELYDEIVRGYEAGIREIYVAGEDGPRRLTKEDELDALDAAYKKTVDSFVTMEQTNQRARTIIGEEAEKIAKISRRETKAAGFLKEQKARGIDKVPENLNQKMLSAVVSFKEKYVAFNPNVGTLSQLLAGIKIS